MEFAQGARRRLTGKEIDPDEVSLVLSRLELALPHVAFERWRFTEHSCNFPEGEVVQLRAGGKVEIRLNIDEGVRLSCVASRQFGQLSANDRQFILHLALEAARIIYPRIGSAMSLFDFGSYAVGEVIKADRHFEGDIVSILRFVRTLTQENGDARPAVWTRCTSNWARVMPT